MKNNNCYTGRELLEMFCRFSQTQWGEQHTPVALKVYTRSGTYTFYADSPAYTYKGDSNVGT